MKIDLKIYENKKNHKEDSVVSIFCTLFLTVGAFPPVTQAGNGHLPAQPKTVAVTVLGWGSTLLTVMVSR
ncbi:MAG: hypothetical protein FWB82_06455 [Treponema sp.]|nr:hypothetical protein [Treponema sp.]